MKLTHRLFALSLVALAPAIGIQIYNEGVTRRAREAEVHELALRNAQQAASEMERVLEGARHLMTAISKVDSVQSLDTAACVPYLAKLQPDVPHLAALLVVDRQGNLRCRQEIPPNSPSFADQPEIQQAIATGAFAVGEHTHAKIAQRPVLPVAIPLRNAGGETIGAIGAAIDLQWLTERLRERGLPPGGSITVADRNGTIVAREPFPERFVGSKIPQGFAHLVHAPAAGAIDVTSQDGTRRVLGYVPATAGAAPGLYVSAGLSSEASYQFVDRATRQGMLVIGIGGLLAILGAWLVGRAFIERPVKRLLNAASAWRAGNLAVRTGLTSKHGDFGSLGEEFDRVVEEVAARESALRESESRFRELADSAPVLIWMAGSKKEGIYFNRPWLEFTGRHIAQELGDGWLDNVHPKDVGALQACAEAFDARRPFQTEFRLRRHDGAWRWVLDTGVPRLDPSGEFRGFIGSCVDITERKRGEERQKLLLNELNHRVKNTLATVQSLAAQTRRAATSLEGFGAAFEDRLLALAKTHDLLTDRGWEGASLAQLVLHELAPYTGPGHDRRLLLKGEDLQLPPKHALALGMAVHELATNAVKYGALSTDTGRIEVTWELVPDREGSGMRLVLSWLEHGGPVVRPPTERGFGSRLVQRSIQNELQGTLDVRFDPKGLQVTFDIPLEGHLSPEREAALA